MNKDIATFELNQLMRVLSEQEWRGIFIKDSFYYKNDDFDLLISNVCPTIASWFGKYQMISAIRIAMLMFDVIIEPCKFTTDFKQVRGFRVLLPSLPK